jgi:hypothetical protein
MINKINGIDNFPALPAITERDFLAALLEAEDETYPWNPADEASEAYFQELEQQFILDDSLETEIAARSQTFYTNLDHLWAELAPHQSLLANIQETLTTTFASGVPQSWLNAIAQKATEIFTTQASIGEKLVECVQAVLPTWEVEDILVLARPYAYAMRSNETKNVTSVIQNLENCDWEALSEIEQAKVSLAISLCALQQLKNSQSEI